MGRLQQMNGISHTNSRLTPLRCSTTSAAGVRSRVRHIQVKMRRLDEVDEVLIMAVVIAVPVDDFEPHTFPYSSKYRPKLLRVKRIRTI